MKVNRDRKVYPSREAITEALKTEYGERIRNKTATLKDWLGVICAAECIQSSWDIVEESTKENTNENEK